MSATSTPQPKSKSKPKTKSKSSPARIAANRANALRSTGPTTAEGKARSRANALKHGLTGAGIALPQEDAAAVAQRFAAIQEELVPQTVLGAFFAHEIALATVRCQRAARHETALLTTRALEAGAAFDQARIDQARHLFHGIHQNPVPFRAKLTATPEGVDCLIGGLHKFALDLRNPEVAWSPGQGNRLAMLFGEESKALVLRLSDILLGHHAANHSPALAHLTTEAQRRDWAREQLLLMIHEDSEHLRAYRATLDHAAIAHQRALVVERALFDASDEATLARQYEAASRRQVYRALHEFHAVEAKFATTDTTEAAAEPAAMSTEPAPATPEAAEPKPIPNNDLKPAVASFKQAAIPVVPAASAPVAAAVSAAPERPRSAVESGSARPTSHLAFTVGRA